MGMILKDTWLLNLGIEWKTSTPLWPQSKGSAESVMKALGKVIPCKRERIGDKNFKISIKLPLNTTCHHKDTSM
jgi:hypothetical protein